LTQNDSKVNLKVKEVDKKHFNLLSKEKIGPVEPLSESQQYKLPSNQDKGLHAANFVTLGKIPEQEKIEIIKTGFRLNQKEKISNIFKKIL
jgi:hypothetical protein